MSGSRNQKCGKTVTVSFLPNNKEWFERYRDVKEKMFKPEDMKPTDTFFVNQKNLPLSNSSDTAIWHLFRKVTGISKANMTQIR